MTTVVKNAVIAGRALGHLWALPNTLVGLLFGIGGQWGWDGKNRVVQVCGGWMAQIFIRLGYAGMCVGDVVLFARLLPQAIYRHELVHATQARILGPLYLPLTLLGYALGRILYPPHPHDASPLEIWADTASGCASTNTYLRHRERHRTEKASRITPRDQDV